MKRRLPLLCLIGATIVLFLFPQDAAQGAAEGLALCARSVVPALFPFLVLSKCAVRYLAGHTWRTSTTRRMHRYFGVGGAGITPLLLSFCGGYPCGVAAVTEVYRQGGIRKSEAERTICFCNNSGPAFFLGVIGSCVLGSVRQGFLLYLIHVLAALLTGIFLSEPTAAVRYAPRETKPTPFGTALVDAITESCRTILQISAFVVFFSVFLHLMRRHGVCPALPHLGQAASEGLLFGLLELSCGVLRLSGLPNALPLCAFLTGWGGLCVHFQALSLWQSAGLSPQGYFAHKALHGLLSAFFAALCLHPTPFFLSVGAGFILLAAFFPKIRKKRGGNLRPIAV